MARISRQRFTRRMIQCIIFAAAGDTMAETGRKLSISARTVLAHLTRAKQLTGAKSTTHLVSICYQTGVLQVGELVKQNYRQAEELQLPAEEPQELEELPEDFKLY